MTQSDSESDPVLTWLAQWRDGDRTALDNLLAHVLPSLHADVRAAMGTGPRGAQESMDVVQEAVLNFLRWGPRFVPQSGGQFRMLLKRIAMNELIDQQRRLSRASDGRHLESIVGVSNPLSGFAGPSRVSPRPSQVAERSEEEQWVRLALQFLPDEDRYLLLASEVEGLDWTTIATELELAGPDTARMRAKRLMPKVANLLRRLRTGKLPSEA